MIKSFYELPALYYTQKRNSWAGHLYCRYIRYEFTINHGKRHFCEDPPPNEVKKYEVPTYAAAYKFIFEQPIDRIIDFISGYAKTFWETVNKEYLIRMLEDLYEAWEEEIAALKD